MPVLSILPMRSLPALLRPLVLLAVLFAAGCSSGPKPRSEYGRGVDFTRYRTFAIHPAPTFAPGVDPGLVQRLGPTLTQAARVSMALKGFVEAADPAAADLLVIVHGSGLPKTAAEPATGGDWLRRYPLAEALGAGTLPEDAYREGMVAAEVYETATRRLVWVGWMTPKVPKKARQAGLEGRADRAADGMNLVFGRFPAMGGMPLR